MTTPNTSIVAQNDVINDGVQILMLGLSETSKRQYMHTFDKWIEYCNLRNLSHGALTILNISDFIQSSDVSFSTRKSRLSHIRNLLKALAASNPENYQIEKAYRESQLYKVKRTTIDKNKSQTHHALSDEAVESIFLIYNKDSKRHIRNRAMLAILFYAGLRRSEVASLKWSDLDFENLLVTIRHGKGDKSRTIPILDGWQYIEEWQNVTLGREFIFCGCTKGNTLADDKPVTSQTVYRVVKTVAKKIGIETLSPHDARRTMITNLLNKRVSVPDVQYLAGHSDSNTTLGYAQVSEATVIAERIRHIIKKPV